MVSGKKVHDKVASLPPDSRNDARLFQVDMLHLDVLRKEDAGVLLELIGILSGEVTGGGTFGTVLLHLRMTAQVVLQTVGDIFPCGTMRTPLGTYFIIFGMRMG